MWIRVEIRKIIDWALGYRTVRTAEEVASTSGGRYLNFTVSGHNTFVDDFYLTHNCIVDDFHSETQSNDGKMEPPSREDYAASWTIWQGILTRLEPKASCLIVMQRWSRHDLTGRLLEAARKNPGSFQWEVVAIPALEEAKDVDGNIQWKSTWPERWSDEEVIRLRETILGEPGGAWRWNSQYQQDPSSDQSSIFKREYWKRWPSNKPAPRCEFVMQSWDMAATKGDRSNYSACTTWGVFSTSEKEDKPVYNLILLDAERGKWEFPDLKQAVTRKYNSAVKDGHPDCVLVEYKSAGIGIVQELRNAGVPVTAIRPGGNQYVANNDKFARGQRVLEILSSGLVWAPQRSWAEEVIEECTEFPNGQYDDYYDTVVQALGRFRDGGFIRLETDEKWDEKPASSPASYYNLG